MGARCRRRAKRDSAQLPITYEICPFVSFSSHHKPQGNRNNPIRERGGLNWPFATHESLPARSGGASRRGVGGAGSRDATNAPNLSFASRQRIIVLAIITSDRWSPYFICSSSL